MDMGIAGPYFRVCGLGGFAICIHSLVIVVLFIAF